MFVIVTDGRKRHELLFMVDRRKQKKSFWSNRLTDVFIFQDKLAAMQKAIAFKFNNPRVISLIEARRSLTLKDDLYTYTDVDYEGYGWDAHKDLI